MAKTPKLTTSEFGEAMQGLRAEFESQLHGLSELLQETRSSIQSSEAGRSDVSASIQRLRTELRNQPQLVELAERWEVAAKQSEVSWQETNQALQNLRDEFRRSVQELSKSVSSVQLSAESTEANWADLSSAIQNLRDELQRRTGELSELVGGAQLQAETDREAAAESLQGLRSNLREEVASLQRVLERSPPPKSSPLIPALASLASLVLGGAGTALFYESTLRPAASVSQVAQLDPQVESTLTSHSQMLTDINNKLSGLSRPSTTRDGQFQALESLLQAFTSLQTTLTDQQRKFDESLEQFRDDLASSERTTVARPAVPATEQSPSANSVLKKSTSSGEADEPDPPPPPPAEPARLVIKNPSPFDLKLLINDQPVDVPARGDTKVPVTKGRVKTQIATLPELVQHWDAWEFVDGQQQLTINVDWQADSYKLR